MVYFFKKKSVASVENLRARAHKRRTSFIPFYSVERTSHLLRPQMFKGQPIEKRESLTSPKRCQVEIFQRILPSVVLEGGMAFSVFGYFL